MRWTRASACGTTSWPCGGLSHCSAKGSRTALTASAWRSCRARARPWGRGTVSWSCSRWWRWPSPCSCCGRDATGCRTPANRRPTPRTATALRPRLQGYKPGDETLLFHHERGMLTRIPVCIILYLVN